ncbi:hypothetical protein [Natrarchaeobaculum sulfurireducens]|uniref:Uncharacterized protein n=1 Tax=Natrarchaeobaculum sulfurireducens TaxID=2044521 RepID=A0A346PER6_9EURY|nr:hypothetical protein [Natrarchaeobaculum sulfurireducens]AXR78011.1 hypothetical protein AArc1_1681 [Natrarchaeobaculum sulfurireducens]
MTDSICHSRPYRGDMAAECANCGHDTSGTRWHHVYLSTDEVVELSLCEGCRYKFVTAEWVTAVV